MLDEEPIELVLISADVDPLIRIGLDVAWGDEISLRETRKTGSALSDEVFACRARAVIVPREAAVEISSHLLGAPIVIGLSVTRNEAVICRAGHVTIAQNATAQGIAHMLKATNTDPRPHEAA